MDTKEQVSAAIYLSDNAQTEIRRKMVCRTEKQVGCRMSITIYFQTCHAQSYIQCWAEQKLHTEVVRLKGMPAG